MAGFGDAGVGVNSYSAGISSPGKHGMVRVSYRLCPKDEKFNADQTVCVPAFEPCPCPNGVPTVEPTPSTSAAFTCAVGPEADCISCNAEYYLADVPGVGAQTCIKGSSNCQSVVNP